MTLFISRLKDITDTNSNLPKRDPGHDFQAQVEFTPKPKPGPTKPNFL